MRAKERTRKMVTFLLVGFVCFLSFSSYAGAAPKIVKFATGTPGTDFVADPYVAYTSIFSSIVEGRTAGRYKVQIFAAKQLGDYRSLMEQCSRGLLEIAAGVDTGILGNMDPNVEALNMPYVFPTTEIGRMVLEGPYGKGLSDELAAKGGVRILSYIPSAFRSFLNNKREIKKPADMKGLKFRVREIPSEVELIKTFGAAATPIPWGELYSALQTGVVDGYESAPYVVLMAKTQEVTKYYTMDNHALNLSSVIISEKFYKSLSPEDRVTFDYAAREAIRSFLGIVTAKEVQDIQTIEKAGVKIYRPTQDEIAEFRKVARDPMMKVFEKTVEKKWINNLFMAIEDAEKQVGYK